MNAKIRKLIRQRKQRLKKRIDKKHMPSSPAILTPNIDYELAERQQAIAAGGLGAVMQLIKQVDLRKHINRSLPLFKLHMPYDEADHGSGNGTAGTHPLLFGTLIAIQTSF